MPQIINTNIMSLNSQRQLNKSQLMQNEAMERLSSGLRVNSAKDDAAGLAIATGMESQIRGINQAVRNANDGISMSQTAEGAMDEMTSILQRIRELSIQSANDTNSASNRQSIQAEVDQLYDELDRIANVTQFNGVNVLDGSIGSTTLQIGANAGENLTFAIDSVTTRDLNLNAVSGLGELNGGRVNNGSAINADDITINGVGLGGIATGANRAILIETEINSKSGISGVTASAYNVVEGVGGQTGVSSGLQVNGVTLGSTGSMKDLVDTINRDVPGVVASVGNNGSLVLSNDTGADIVIGANGSQVGLPNTDTFRGFIALTSADQTAVEVSTGTAATSTASQVQQIGFNLVEGSDKLTGGEVTAVAITGADGIQINGIDLGEVTGTSAADKAFAINTISGETGVTASATTEVKYEVVFPGTTNSNLTLNGTVIALGAGVVSLDDVVSTINSSGIQGVVATADATTGSIILTSQSGSDISVTTDDAASLHDGTAFLGVGVADVTLGDITLTGENGKDVIVTSTAASEAAKDTALGKLGLIDFGGSASAIGTGLSVLTVANAENTIERIDSALEQISNSRAELGAVQNRLASTISNLENVSQNLSASKSRIVDADFAAETSKLSKAQILQQAGTAMLSQANASTQNVLSLLQG
ncbi:FliC/FljB family flagellin [Colwellia sp. KU-HH00111]|uniref:flagellin N-terminal helical domain-containing protein n=1 Tax=Colwellia sp. KU-HH00111 TaxID=3127652 RepID=UPI00310734A1